MNNLFSTGLEGAAFQSRLPVDKLSAEEASSFPDVAQSIPASQKLFLHIRNRLVLPIKETIVFPQILMKFSHSYKCGLKIQKLN